MTVAASTLVCHDLECGYHGHLVLSQVGLVISAGESVALLGANGSGKSTLIKTLNGELRPLGGWVELKTEGGSSSRMDKLSPAAAARLVAMTPQEEPTPFAFTVLEVVAMGRLAQSSGIFDSDSDLVAARDAMARVECDHLAARAITELSGGEKQRVLIARSLAQDTPVLLMDEPTSHLDPPHQLALAQLLKQLAEEGKIIVSAVHDLNLAGIIASRAVLISDGRVIADGLVEEVLQSSRLESCYHSNFERVRSPSGRLLVFPSEGTY